MVGGFSLPCAKFSYQLCYTRSVYYGSPVAVQLGDNHPNLGVLVPDLVLQVDRYGTWTAVTAIANLALQEGRLPFSSVPLFVTTDTFCKSVDAVLY